jgi:hypothetical protein
VIGGGKKDDDTKTPLVDPPIAITTPAEAGIAEAIESHDPPRTGQDAAVAIVPTVKQPVVPTLDAAVEAPADETIAIHVQSVPPGGDVILDGEFIGVAPVDVKRKRVNKHVALMVRHAKFEDAKSTIDLSGDASRTVTLLAKKPDTTTSVIEHPKQPDPNAHVNQNDHKQPDPNAHKTPPPPPDPKKKCQQPGQYNPYDSRPICK